MRPLTSSSGMWAVRTQWMKDGPEFCLGQDHQIRSHGPKIPAAAGFPVQRKEEDSGLFGIETPGHSLARFSGRGNEQPISGNTQLLDQWSERTCLADRHGMNPHPGSVFGGEFEQRVRQQARSLPQRPPALVTPQQPEQENREIEDQGNRVKQRIEVIQDKVHGFFETIANSRSS